MQAIMRHEVPIAVQGEGIELRKQNVGSMSVAFVRAAKGIDLRPALRGLPGDLCPCPHWGYIIKGKVRMHTQAEPHDYEAGQAFYWAPGHAPEMLEDTEYVDFSPTLEFENVISHITRTT